MLLRALPVICLLYCTTCFSDEIQEMHDALLSEIVSSDCECIYNVVDGKAYINPERIFPTRQGLFLRVNANQYTPISLLYSDAQGCYIQSVSRIKVTSPCPHCGWDRISGAIKCRNPNCPSNQPKE
jgi:hypothetical protein